jgi:multicomponent Na+:H+ antiporter subunit G
MTTILSSILVLTGVTLTLTAAIGLHRFPDVFARMHAATKPATLGLMLTLLGTAIRMGGAGDVAKLALVIVLQFITAPVGAHMIGRAAYRAGTELADDTTIDELADARARTAQGG